MILIDTSAWIEFFRRKADPATKARVQDCLTAQQAAFTCPIRFELILGARPAEMDDLQTGLSLARHLPMESRHWENAAFLGARLRGRGLHLPASDLLIATLAVQQGLPLLSRDEHFPKIKEYALPALRLA